MSPPFGDGERSRAEGSATGHANVQTCVPGSGAARCGCGIRYASGSSMCSLSTTLAGREGSEPYYQAAPLRSHQFAARRL